MTNYLKRLYTLFFLQKLYLKLNTIIITISIATLIFAILEYISRNITLLVPFYLDERVYMQCGLKYISGIPPILCNFEHPPLGKYIIGAFISINAGILLLIFNYFLSLFLFYKITYVLTLDQKISLYTVLITGFDTVFMLTYMHYLLDPIAFSLLLATLYLYIIVINSIKEKNQNNNDIFLRLLGLSSGLTLATKWQTAYALLGVLIALFWLYFKYYNLRISFLKITKLSAVLIASYFATFVMDFKAGAIKPIEHNIIAMNYMSYRHGLSPPIALIGVIKLLSRVEIWRLASLVVIYVTTTSISPNTISLLLLNSTSITSNTGLFIRVGIGVPSILWPILFPIYLLVLKARLEKGRFRELDPLIVVASTSLFNLLNGPLDWYYIYVVPFLYIITIAYISSYRKGRYIVALLLLTQFIHCLLFFLKVIPYANDLSI